MRIRDVMIPDAVAAHPETTLRAVAQMMRSLDVILLPVVKGGCLVGTVSEHDIVARGLALGFHPESASVADVMSHEAPTCSDEDDLHELFQRMKDGQVHRLFVVDGHHRLLGIVSLEDLAVILRTGTREALSGLPPEERSPASPPMLQ